MIEHHVFRKMRNTLVLVSMMLGGVNAVSAQTGSTSVSNYIENAPYAHFIKYHYAGTESAPGSRDVIMEYAPDSNGLFQVTVWENQKATCYVYQVKSDGIYEVACFEAYNDVVDNRYTDLAKDEHMSLELPSELKVGHVYYSGYEKNVKNTVVAVNMAYTINQKRYENTVKVQRENEDGTVYYYFAPKVGLIAIEDASGNPKLMLTETYGNLNFEQ